jgi:hypothetical protein
MHNIRNSCRFFKVSPHSASQPIAKVRLNHALEPCDPTEQGILRARDQTEQGILGTDDLTKQDILDMI